MITFYELKYFCLGWYSPTLKLSFDTFWLALFQLKAKLTEKNITAELGESHPLVGVRLTCESDLSQGQYVGYDVGENIFEEICRQVWQAEEQQVEDDA